MIQVFSIIAGCFCLAAGFVVPFVAPVGVLCFMLAALVQICELLANPKEPPRDPRIDRLIEIVDELKADSAMVRRIKEIEHHRTKVANGERK